VLSDCNVLQSAGGSLFDSRAVDVTKGPLIDLGFIFLGILI
jgi:hypothetical protein